MWPRVRVDLVNWSCMTDRPTDHLTLDEAAAVLGISREAVRLRVRRGTLDGARVGGIWYVTLVGRSSTDHTTDRPTDRPRYPRRRDTAERDELAQHLRDEVDFLRDRVKFYERQVEHQAGEIADLRRQLPPPATGEGPEEGTAPPMPFPAPERPLTRRPWPPWYIRLWRRWQT